MQRIRSVVPIWILSMVALSTVMFVLTRLTPGGPCAAYKGGLAAGASRVACTRVLALDSIVPTQIAIQIGLYLHGDFGTTNLGHPVRTTIVSAIPATAMLWLLTLLALSGIAAASRKLKRRAPAAVTRDALELLRAVPIFWLALLGLYFVAYRWSWLPPSHGQSIGVPSVGSRIWLRQLPSHAALQLGDALRHFALPAMSLLGVMLAASHVPASRWATDARGGNAWLTLARRTSVLVGGTVVIEWIFQINGLGYLFVRSLHGQDYPIALSLFLLASVLTVSITIFGSPGATAPKPLRPPVQAKGELA
ncbi:MAG: ABC transporter permease [Chloroflexota bacterium]